MGLGGGKTEGPVAIVPDGLSGKALSRDDLHSGGVSVSLKYREVPVGILSGRSRGGSKVSCDSFPSVSGLDRFVSCDFCRSKVSVSASITHLHRQGARIKERTVGRNRGVAAQRARPGKPCRSSPPWWGAGSAVTPGETIVLALYRKGVV